MADYEAAAFESVEQLKERHVAELQELSERIVSDTTLRARWSRELLELRRQEKIYFSVKDYEKAESTRVRADTLQAREASDNESQI